MRLHRFYVLQPLGEEVVIEDVSLVNQWTKVFRYNEGDFVTLFNGDGNDYCYSLTSVTKRHCTLKRTKLSPSYIPKQKITLCLSVIKKDNFELVVQKATELGVTTIIPILSSRSEKKNLSFERLEKIAIESAEQCGRGDIPTIKEITPLRDVLASLNDRSIPLILSMDGNSITSLKNEEDLEPFLFIGPEGGWGSDDLALMYEVPGYSLGKTVLRAETAAIVAVSAITLLS